MHSGLSPPNWWTYFITEVTYIAKPNEVFCLIIQNFKGILINLLKQLWFIFKWGTFSNGLITIARLETFVRSDTCCCFCMCYRCAIDVQHIVQCHFAVVLEHKGQHMFVKGFFIYLYILTCFLGTSTALFVSLLLLIVAWVMCITWVALSSIDHVVLIWSNCFDLWCGLSIAHYTIL